MASAGTQSLSVNVKISINGQFLSGGDNRTAIKSITVRQTYDGQNGNATIRLLADSVKRLDPVSEESTSATATIRINGAQIYRGRITKATEREDGEVVIQLVSRVSKLTEKYATIETPRLKGVKTTDVLQKIFNSAGFAGRNYKIDIQQKTHKTSTSFTIEENATVREALEQVAALQTAYIYVDAKDRVVVTDNPFSKVWAPTVFKSAEKGDEDDTKKRVIVKAPDQGTDILASATATSTVEGAAGKPKATANQTEVKKDHSAQDKRTAAQVALQEIIKNRTRSNVGTVELIGEPRIRPYDGIKVNLPKEHTPLNDLDGIYTIKNVKHKFSATDGYTTKVDLMKNLKLVCENIEMDPAGFTTGLVKKMYTGSPTKIDPSDVNGGLSRFRSG